jgi:hypothetical protein
VRDALAGVTLADLAQPPRGRGPDVLPIAGPELVAGGAR